MLTRILLGYTAFEKLTRVMKSSEIVSEVDDFEAILSSIIAKGAFASQHHFSSGLVSPNFPSPASLTLWLWLPVSGVFPVILALKILIILVFELILPDLKLEFFSLWSQYQHMVFFCLCGF